jgi:hypothetical protein
MGRTTGSNVFHPELLEKSLAGAFGGIALMAATGAAVINSSLMAGPDNVGETVTVPYFNSIGELEDIASDGDGLTAKTFSQSTETAQIQHSGKMVEFTRLARSGADNPYGEAAR